MNRYRSIAAGMMISGFVLCGCTTSSSTPAPKTEQTNSKSTVDQSISSAATSSSASTAKSTGATPRSGYWEDYPDVPKVEIMTEVDGIQIPRMKSSTETLKLKGSIPADVGNEHAKRHPSVPATGDTLTMRFNAEPKVLNLITENSAVMHYIMFFAGELFARQNFESFEFEPALASKWVVEDSVKLSADFPNRERRVALGDGSPQSMLELDYVLPAAEAGKPADRPKVTIKTFDKGGQPLGHVWVGIYPVGRIVGASATGHHYWSDPKGQLEVSGFPTGKYTVKTGDEIFGQSVKNDDGSLKVTPASSENPLKEPLTLSNGEWQDIQAQTYMTFYLRKDAKWSDGAPFTTKDVEFGSALLNNPTVDGDWLRTYYTDLVECTALGSHTIRLRYRQQYFKAAELCFEAAFRSPPWHFFEAIFREQGRELTLDRLTPEEEKARKQISAHGQEFGKFFNTDERYNRKPLGTGPYMVDRWERGDRVELVRNPNFSEPSRAGHVDRIIVKFIIDQVSALAAMKAGEIDFMFDMSPEQYFEDWPNLDKEIQENFVRASWFTPTFFYVGWNQLASPLKDRRVRIALTMLFDRHDFIDKKLHGEGIVVSGPQYFFGPGYDHELAPIGYDPEAARELLTEAGWIDSDNDGILDRKGEKFQLLLRIPLGRRILEQTCEVIQKDFKGVGIDLQIQTMEWASYQEKARSKECDAIAARWVLPMESDPFQIWHSSEGVREKRGSNMVSFRNSQADELIEMMRVTLDEGKRYRIHQSFNRLIDSEQPYTFMWIPKDFGVYHKRFRNVKWYRLRPVFDLAEWYVPKDEQLHK